MLEEVLSWLNVPPFISTVHIVKLIKSPLVLYFLCNHKCFHLLVVDFIKTFLKRKFQKLELLREVYDYRCFVCVYRDLLIFSLYTGCPI